jgi:hypothetical protein
MASFEMNGKFYRTDKETLNVLDGIMPSAIKNNDLSALAAVMFLGLESGRICEVKN